MDMPSLALGGSDAVRALAIDGGGSIYACGSLWNGANDIPALIKVTSTGSLEWAQSVGPGGQTSGLASAVQIDRTLGLVDVAGRRV